MTVDMPTYYRDMMANPWFGKVMLVEASLEHLPSFLIYVNEKLNGSLLTDKYLYRRNVSEFWPSFCINRSIRLSNGEDTRLSPSDVCYALIRTYSPSGARPRAHVQDRSLIQLGERAMEVIRDGFDRRRGVMKAHLDRNSRR